MEYDTVDASYVDEEKSWSSFNLDPRLENAILKLKWKKPTLVQSNSIPLVLEGKDVLARALTGSGKTGAYCIPIIEKIINEKENASKEPILGPKALILVPTSELCEQVYHVVQSLTLYCNNIVRSVYISSDIPVESQKLKLSEYPDIIIATPGRLVLHLEKKNVELAQSLNFIVIDESDLILSFGFEADLKKISKYLPKICQGYLASATLTDDVNFLKDLILHNPVLLTIKEEVRKNLLTQYYTEIKDEDKFLLIYIIIKLKLMTGKAILFVNNIDKCYKLKLFLERLSIKSVVLNNELPQNSRFHIIQEFNKGIFNLLIATDAGEDEQEDEDEQDNEEDEEQEQDNKAKKKSKNNSKSKHYDNEYGISRGIDFKDVKNIVNFDFPSTLKSYVHRVGRTARAYNTGVSLSFVTQNDKELFEKVVANQAKEGAEIKPYIYKKSILENFRYRIEDVLRSVTKVAIREARYAEIKEEILNSEKLKTFFEENPKELETLRHDKILQSSRVLTHLKTIPDYLLPTKKKEEIAQNLTPAELDEQYNEHFGIKMKSRKRKVKPQDPLKNFEYGQKVHKRRSKRRK